MEKCEVLHNSLGLVIYLEMILMFQITCKLKFSPNLNHFHQIKTVYL